MFSDMVLRTIRAPESKQATTLLVAVRCRPIAKDEKEEGEPRDILRVLDDKVVVVLDPDVSKEYLDRVQNRSKERKYAFDIAFGGESTNRDVYGVTIGSMVEGVVRGLNATVFAYGATGSGKTHTMAGTPDDPGLMVLSLQTIFNLIVKKETEYEFDVTCSYLEVYNEVIYDLLEPKSGHLELREDPDQGITVAGLKRIQVTSAEKILELLHQGNSRRKTESTDANATSSRSHAVLEIIVKRKQRNQYRAQVLRGKLALVDLAGSERASETNNAGQKLRDGANINRSLLALANCINALGKQQKRGLAYVPYRNSKLTRLLKDGLSGNSRTVMVATVSSGDHQYHQTINTLKYADRAKEIKTHIQTNVGTVDAHVADYQRMIDNLQVEVTQLRRELAEKESQLTAKSSETRADDELSWLDVLSRDINENVEERINLQKALFELEDTNVHNRAELQQLDDGIAEAHSLGKEIDKGALKERQQVVLDNIRDNDEAGARYREEIEQNEGHRKELQRMIDDAISSDRNKTFLRILSQYRLLGMTNMELQFQMAVRDQIIQDQREALSNLWLVLECSGLNRKQILKIAARQGIVIEEGSMPARGFGSSARSVSSLYNKQQSLSPAAGPRHSNPTSPDVGLTRKSSRGWTDYSSRDENDVVLSTSPRTPRRDWRNSRSSDNNNGSNSQQLWNNSHRAQNARHKFQNRTGDGVPTTTDGGNGHYGGWVSSSQTVRGVETQSSRDRFSLPEGLLGRTGQEQNSNSSGLPGTRGRSRTPPLAVQELNTPVRQKRRPRSSESQLRQSKWGTERGNGREKESSTIEDDDDDASEDSGVENNNNDSGNRNDWTVSRASDRSGALDNDMLRKELSRLDTELQDLKRGMSVNSAMRWESNPMRTPYLAHEGDNAQQQQHRRASTPSFGGGGVRPVVGHNNNGLSNHPGFANGDGQHGNDKGENNNGHVYPAAPYGVAPLSTWDARGWSKAAGALNSGMLLDANGPRVSAFGSGGDVLESMSPKMKAILDRRKFRVEGSQPATRQVWPWSSSEWHQSSS